MTPKVRECIAFRLWHLLAILLVGAACTLVIPDATPAHAQRARIAPEADSGRYAKGTASVARKYMVAAANPLAVDAGLDMLRRGGSAVDAAIATQLVLNLVEPQSSGIGGGAFLVHWDDALKSMVTYDGRETAPASATPTRFMNRGRRMNFFKVVKSGLSIGVPGLVRLMEAAHRKHGRLPWKTLFQPAIRLARDGFAMTNRLNFLLRWAASPGAFAPGARAYFYDDEGLARPVGYTMRNPEFATTLERISEEGAAAFYTGAIAAEIVKAVAAAPTFAGDMTSADLAGYRARERPPVCSAYRDVRICGMGPPSSGATTVAQILKLAEPFDLAGNLAGRPPRPMNTQALHILGEAGRLAYADRDRYIADPDFVAVPTAGLVDPAYLSGRSRLIDPRRAASSVAPGRPPGATLANFGRGDTQESAGTSHISIVDARGNVVSMTTTIESAFGSGLWAAGFLLNNELTDFSFRNIDRRGRPVANRIEPGKRPRSSMAPIIVFNGDGSFRAALGSPGGSRIILYVAKALVAMIDWQLDPQAAAGLANFGSRGRAFELEYDPALATNQVLAPWSTVPSVWRGIRLRALGHSVRPDLMTSGLHIIERRGDVLLGGADPRREGVARGD